MALAYSANQTFDYVLEEDRGLPAEQQTTWLLRYLSSLELSAVMNRSMTDSGGNAPANFGTLQLDVLKAGLTGWSNLLDEEGVIVEFAKEGKQKVILDKGCFPPTMATLDRINPVHKTELVNQILSSHTLDDDETKN